MANNRMWIKNTRTGAEVLIAKYYPRTGWYVAHEDLRDRLNKLFDENDAAPSQWGDNDWTISYDAQPKTP